MLKIVPLALLVFLFSCAENAQKENTPVDPLAPKIATYLANNNSLQDSLGILSVSAKAPVTDSNMIRQCKSGKYHGIFTDVNAADYDKPETFYARDVAYESVKLHPGTKKSATIFTDDKDRIVFSQDAK